jgi:hypothetical protein
MIALRASSIRRSRIVFAIVAALVIALTSLVAAAPKAGAAYRFHCVVSKVHVRRGGTDAALCRHGGKLYRGQAYVINRHHRPHHVRLKVFRTGKRGNALFGFRIKRHVPLGRVVVHVRDAAHKRTSFIIFVRRAKHHHHRHHR